MLTPDIGVVITSHCNVEFIQLILPDQTVRMVSDNSCHIQIVFDTNTEQTLLQLENLGIHPKRMILTNNPCPEYLKDLQCCQPMAIIHNPNTVLIQQAFQAMQLGQYTEIIPKSLANLSLKESIILRFIAIGKSDKEIGGQIGLSDGSVRNIISRELLPKLQKAYPTHTLKNRKHLSITPECFRVLC
jgi:DNA-binding NarL/FixJ family response regulator